MKPIRQVASTNHSGSQFNCVHWYSARPAWTAVFTRCRGGQSVQRTYQLDLEHAVRLSDLVRGMANRGGRLLVQPFADGWTVSSTWTPTREMKVASYQIWSNVHSGEAYAIRLEDGKVTGVYGPLHHTELEPKGLSEFHYDDVPEDVEWVIENDSEFVLVEA